MIASLAGLLTQVESDRCVLDVNGVGYLVFASTRTLSALPAPPELARVLVETVVREDAILLYGFSDSAERDWFRLLTGIQGVGARVALGLLSTMSPSELIAAISSADKASLTRAPGVGGRLAERLLTELRDKAPKMPGGGPGAGNSSVIAQAGQPASIERDALLALAGLGFRRAEAWPVVTKIIARDGEGATLDAVIRGALKELAR
ncbi:Holliday junction branch migration protein RuvA [Acetobacter oeni]|uniref:Holliday junction branch migration complex subunit RuvA n=1 Tax=Acetobacter oeni TaxID=304077 RepID=A0A511XL84_9PROT|nr:Holliday junction branch migration protein RuvA [Acetobacter oeni]MBB3883921.1 Holliday junction DNA helicase RuvA [Acetobacter oeni]NHO19928.1 Holliday junction branch migration protein RuvA [Acetobacter oeni]GBR02664.1 Holliday junction DNA helicase RuvA [Acetobacter oeni LMG 21952]GEN63696.1 Holliday junction ATP-dependent DNA helicase RuvA [Acetobacter oeni]